MVKKDSLIKGTIILAAAALVARFLGIFQRIPLDYMTDSHGGGYFTVANNIYLMLLIVATGGIPSAISKMVSERYALGRPDEARRIYKAALLFGAVTGVLITVLLLVFAPFYATHIAEKPGADLAVRAIAPALLFFPVIAMMRGYFQGRQFMAAGGISQIVEQILRVITAVGLAYLALAMDWGQSWIAAAATFGSVFGSVGAFAVMLSYARKLKRQDAKDAASAGAAPRRAGRSVLSFGAIYRELFKISVPIVITSMTVQFIYFFDTSFFMKLTHGYYAAADADQMLDWLGVKAQALAGIPPILAIALSQSMIPIISSAYKVKNMKEVERQASLVMRIVVFTGVPVSLIMTVAALSITGLLFSNTGGSGAVAALTAGTIFQITMMTSNTVLTSMNKPRLPMRHALIGIVVKVATSLILAPLLGVYGIILSSTICFMAIASLNFRQIRKEIRLNILGTRWAGYALTIAIASGAGWLVDYACRTYIGGTGIPVKITYAFSCIAAGVVSLGLYVALLILLKVVTHEDVQQFPGALRRLLSPLMRLAGRRGPESSR
ncbi:polysaccharide biosynthesis protein [Paenibacillus sp. MWE-103]|uniref:Polysaccharide biosynthesis protein n=1 Tax=Paenibacillus artemisiicola TaxID=1172618 RepID=A0ABS3WA48_9BACL|nr:polysaccharide biosynthesis protein [Paenibacillus artemisiicola]MBO7745185.1 polysaccharide biosynthesis protein [Paenibacillus artemisiicola]